MDDRGSIPPRTGIFLLFFAFRPSLGLLPRVQSGRSMKLAIHFRIELSGECVELYLHTYIVLFKAWCSVKPCYNFVFTVPRLKKSCGRRLCVPCVLRLCDLVLNLCCAFTVDLMGLQAILARRARCLALCIGDINANTERSAGFRTKRFTFVAAGL
jgi:hypothetical protein